MAKRKHAALMKKPVENIPQPFHYSLASTNTSFEKKQKNASAFSYAYVYADLRKTAIVSLSILLLQVLLSLLLHKSIVKIPTLLF